MNLFRKVAEKIFEKEFAEFRTEIKTLKDQNEELEKRRIEHNDKYEKQLEQYTKLYQEHEHLGRRVSDLEKENEILRKYYDLDKEPTDEIKVKMHIDLEINRLKEENLKNLAFSHATFLQLAQSNAYALSNFSLGNVFNYRIGGGLWRR